jgi:hypothetical protein
MARAIAPVFALRQARPRENLHQSFAGANRADQVSKFLRRLPQTVHFAFI